MKSFVDHCVKLEENYDNMWKTGEKNWHIIILRICFFTGNMIFS